MTKGKTWGVTGSLLIGVYAAHLVQGAYFPSEAQKRESCGCEEICPEKIMVHCKIPACSREHGHKLMAPVLQDWIVISKEAKTISLFINPSPKRSGNSSKVKVAANHLAH